MCSLFSLNRDQKEEYQLDIDASLHLAPYDKEYVSRIVFNSPNIFIFHLHKLYKLNIVYKHEKSNVTY
jgi:hypothetical protein